MTLWGKNTNISQPESQIVLFSKNSIKKEQPEVDYMSAIERSTNQYLSEKHPNDPIPLYSSEYFVNEEKPQITTSFAKVENQFEQNLCIPIGPSFESELQSYDCTSDFFNTNEVNEVKPFLNMENKEIEELLHEEIHIKDENEIYGCHIEPVSSPIISDLDDDNLRKVYTSLKPTNEFNSKFIQATSPSIISASCDDNSEEVNTMNVTSSEHSEEISVDHTLSCGQDNRSNDGIKNYITQSVSRKNKKKTICKFCRNSVTNFERHVTRHHADEKEVKDYLGFSKNTKHERTARRNILALLRYETEFVEFIQNDQNDFKRMPCAHCKRLVSEHYLSRHYKVCAVRPINESGRRISHRALSQTMLVCANDDTNTLRLKKEVFPKMRPDHISLVAKKDPLIRHFGENYLKKHKRARIVIPCSNKLRECARLLIEVRRRTSNSNLSFFDMLNTSFFDTVTASTKSISGYSEETKSYKAPSLAMHMGTLLKQASNLATNLLLMRSKEFQVCDVELKLKDLTRFKILIDSQWSIELSSLALKNVSENKWNKPIVHKKDNVTITQDAYQTAKVLKLLALFDKGEGFHCKEKPLEDINIEPPATLPLTEKTNHTPESMESRLSEDRKEDNEVNEKKRGRRKSQKRVRWTQQQKDIVLNYFRKHVKEKKPPKKDECLKLIATHLEIFDNIDWVRMKTFVYNTYVKNYKN